ncbi:MAG: hypothetical protein FJ035_08710 [Chloroflexi bacterium]|nr:hypothetical protein [Chloroflexota bacterium]
MAITGTLPSDPDDRVRIARTTNLFTRLMATILAMDDITARRHGFRAVETQLEVADALMRGELSEVERLVRETLRTTGISGDQLRAIEDQLRRHLESWGGLEDDRAPGG